MKNFKNSKPKTKTYQDNDTFDKPIEPTKESVVHAELSVKANRGLPKAAVTMLADPFADTFTPPTIYPIINVDNPKIGGSYNGRDNLDGGNAQQYPSSVRSGFLKAFDTSTMRASINYRYLPIKPVNDRSAIYPGKLLIDEMRNVLSEAASQLSATTFTQMPIYEYGIRTNLPMGSAVPVAEIDGVPYYNKLPDILYAYSIMYQITWLSISNVISSLNSFRLKQGEMIRNGWNRKDVPNLNTFFGLMNKAAFKNKVNGICMQFAGEYVDTDFAEQLNVLTVTPSRRSEDMLSPTMEVGVTYNAPTVFEAYIDDPQTNRPVQDSSPVFSIGGTLTTQVVTGRDNAVEMDLFEICDELISYLSSWSTVTWARNNEPDGDNANIRFNSINWLFDAITVIISNVKNSVDDLRQAYDTLARVGVLSYTKGFKPSIVKDTDAKYLRNLLVEDMYRVAFAGAQNLEYSDITKRWRFFTLWNKYTGVPEYDVKSGGAFLSFSFKDIRLGNMSDDGTVGYLPKLFDNDDYPYIYLVNRSGKVARITTTTMVMADDVVLARLAPLPSQKDEVLRVALLDLEYAEGGNITYDTQEYSYIYKTLQDLFMLGVIPTSNNTNYDISLSHDVVAIYQVEVEDITNDAITYARYWAPFRGAIGEPTNLGFKTALK